MIGISSDHYSYIFFVFLSLLLAHKIIQWFPLLLHRKKNLGPKGSVQLIGHRGSRLEGLPENTISAFKDAIDGGVDMIELDVWLSQDGKVVVHHDENFTRMCGGGERTTLPIHQTEFKHFPRIVPYEHQRERISQFPDDEVFRIPLFEEVLRVVPDSVAILIEFKQDSDRLIAEVQRLLTEAGGNRKRNVYWFSLKEKINKKLLAAEPSIPRVVSIVGMLKIFALYYIGLLPFLPIDYGAFGIPISAIDFDRINHESALAGVPIGVKRILAFLLAGKPPHLLNAPALFAHLRARGMAVIFMDVDDDTGIRVAGVSGATAILTDQPKSHAKYLREVFARRR